MSKLRKRISPMGNRNQACAFESVKYSLTVQKLRSVNVILLDNILLVLVVN